MTTTQKIGMFRDIVSTGVSKPVGRDPLIGRNMCIIVILSKIVLFSFVGSQLPNVENN